MRSVAHPLSGFVLAMSTSSDITSTFSPQNQVSSSSATDPHKSRILLKPAMLTCLSLSNPQSLSPPNYYHRDQVGAKESASGFNVPQTGYFSNGNVTYRRISPPSHLNSTSCSQTNWRPQQPINVAVTPLRFAPPMFPLRNRTNLQAKSPNFLIQTILKDSQQVKGEYEQYKRETKAKLLEQDVTIRNLKKNMEQYQKKLQEMKLQKEVYIAREEHAFKEIQQGIHNLMDKVAVFAQTESLKLGAVVPPAEIMSNLPRNEDPDLGVRYADLVQTLKSLQDKFASFDGKNQDVLSTYKEAEENWKSNMVMINQKLTQIMLYVMGQSECSPPQLSSKGDGETDASFYNASAEDNLDSDICELASQTIRESPEPDEDPSRPITVEELKPEIGVEDMITEVPTVPIKIAFGSEHKSSSMTVIKRRKRKSTCTNKPLRKRLCRTRRRRETSLGQNRYADYKYNLESDDDCEPPPILSLPTRIAKHAQVRPQAMPVLQPEIKLEQNTEQKENSQQENRKDDALIGIKKENTSTEVHGKDFTKDGFVCLCGAKFTGAGGLYVHQVKSMEIEKFACRSCGKKFHYFSGLKAHRKSAHKQDFTQEVGCSRCGQVFKSKKERQGHLDERGLTCWLSGSYQSKDWEAIRSRKNLSPYSSCYSSSEASSQNATI